MRREILEKVAGGDYHILYLSPETLLARSDVKQLIGNRTIGMIIIDEAHIVTTWGKQFRPDYWYLGDHIRKLRKIKLRKKENPLLLAPLQQQLFIAALKICTQKHETACI